MNKISFIFLSLVLIMVLDCIPLQSETISDSNNITPKISIVIEGEGWKDVAFTSQKDKIADTKNNFAILEVEEKYRSYLGRYVGYDKDNNIWADFNINSIGGKFVGFRLTHSGKAQVNEGNIWKDIILISKGEAIESNNKYNIFEVEINYRILFGNYLGYDKDRREWIDLEYDWKEDKYKKGERITNLPTIKWFFKK